jgi:hypothetical protein
MVFNKVTIHKNIEISMRPDLKISLFAVGLPILRRGRLFFWRNNMHIIMYVETVMIHEITVFSVSITIQRSYHFMALFLFIL